ncbi:MAG: hypothetical protein KDB07_09860 [Planctomycetes bacterium]|nr:hypothetical protein [Planctomycetota bacterium]
MKTSGPDAPSESQGKAETSSGTVRVYDSVPRKDREPLFQRPLSPEETAQLRAKLSKMTPYEVVGIKELFERIVEIEIDGMKYQSTHGGIFWRTSDKDASRLLIYRLGDDKSFYETNWKDTFAVKAK